jgi:glycosyltransferase involved in cell wall biosynthesis
MRIGIDGHVLGKNVGGVERFVRELVQQLPTEAPQHKYIVFVTKSEFAKLNQQHTQVQYVPLAFANPMIERLILLPWLAYKYRLDALIVQRLAPWFCGKCQLVATVHDLTPIKFKSHYRGLSNHLVRLLTKNTIKRASLILTPTNAIKIEIQEYCPEAKAPIVAFYNGVDTAKFKQAKNLIDTKILIDAPYVLTVGAIEKRKNIETILEAFALLKTQTELHLVIVGGIRDQAYFDSLQVLWHALGLQDRVHYFGFMDESDLIAIYQKAAIFVTASKDEGFNIPPLESMACGVPVLCSDIPVHQELFFGAAMFFKADAPKDLMDKIVNVQQQSQLQASLKEQGQVKVALYTWQQTAKNVVKALAYLKN